MDLFQEWLSEPENKRKYKEAKDEYDDAVARGETTGLFEWAARECSHIKMYAHHSGPDAYARMSAKLERLEPLAQLYDRHRRREERAEQEKIEARGRAFKSRGKGIDALSKTILTILPSKTSDVFRRLHELALSRDRVIQEVDFEERVVRWKGSKEKETSFESIEKHRLPELRKKIKK